MMIFCGKPLIWWTINHAIQWDKGHILVSTDDNDIAKYVREEFPDISQVWQRRSYGYDPDDTPKMEVVRCATEDWARWEGTYPDVIVDLDVTNPCRTVEHIKGAWELWKETEAPSVVSVTPARRNPHFNTVKELPSGAVVMAAQASDTPGELYDINANIYIYKRDFLLKKTNNHPITFRTRLYKMPRWTAIDIDYYEDYIQAQALFEEFKKGGFGTA